MSTGALAMAAIEISFNTCPSNAASSLTLTAAHAYVLYSAVKGVRALLVYESSESDSKKEK